MLDDSEGWRLAVELELGAAGHEVRCFARSRDVAAADLDWCEAAFLDWHLEYGQFGDDVSGVLGIRRPDVPVWVVTASPSAQVVEPPASVRGVLDKGAGTGQLLQLLAALG